ncbi:MAG TPA: cupin domain-containing protein [Burkholderiaceae bacterium]|nr:cupin domain-containing protein [Burkholderiaceae bacterium]
MNSGAKVDIEIPRIIGFAQHAATAEPSRPPADRILWGDPQQVTWNHYSDPTGQFHTGVWQGEPGGWRVHYAPQEEELCTLIEGRVRLTDAEGRAQEFSPGATFVVPGGFVGVWENLTRVRKVYAIATLRIGTPASQGTPRQTT